MFAGEVESQLPRVPRVVDRCGELGVMSPGSAVEVVGPDGSPLVVDDADLGVHVDRNALWALQPVDCDPARCHLVQGCDRAVAPDQVRRPGDPAILVGKLRKDSYHCLLYTSPSP